MPGPPLSAFVSLFWLHEGEPPAHRRERLMPDGSMQLVINLRKEAMRVYDRDDLGRELAIREALISGPRANYFVIDTATQVSLVGVHFKPGGAAPFLGLPADEVRDQSIALEVFWRRQAGVLRERLLAAATPEDKFRALEQVLLERAARPLTRHPAVAFALDALDAAPQTQRMADLIDRIGYSQRRFIQLFRGEIGLTPKLYARVQRFQRVMKLLHRAETVDWTELALACGYFDQAHFIKEFRGFSGLSPSAYLSSRGDRLNHVAITE